MNLEHFTIPLDLEKEIEMTIIAQKYEIRMAPSEEFKYTDTEKLTSENAKTFVKEFFKDSFPNERLFVLGFNPFGEFIGFFEAGKGSIGSAKIVPRQIIQPLLQLNASACMSVTPASSPTQTPAWELSTECWHSNLGPRSSRV